MCPAELRGTMLGRCSKNALHGLGVGPFLGLSLEISPRRTRDVDVRPADKREVRHQVVHALQLPGFHVIVDSNTGERVTLLTSVLMHKVG